MHNINTYILYVTIVVCTYRSVAIVSCCCTDTITRIPRRVIRFRRWIAGIQDVTCKFSRMIALSSHRILAMQDGLNIRNGACGGREGRGARGGEEKGGRGGGGRRRGGRDRSEGGDSIFKAQDVMARHIWNPHHVYLSVI